MRKVGLAMQSERSFSHAKSAKACVYCVLAGRTPRKTRTEEKKLLQRFLQRDTLVPTWPGMAGRAWVSARNGRESDEGANGECGTWRVMADCCSLLSALPTR